MEHLNHKKTVAEQYCLIERGIIVQNVLELSLGYRFELS